MRSTRFLVNQGSTLWNRKRPLYQLTHHHCPCFEIWNDIFYSWKLTLLSIFYTFRQYLYEQPWPSAQAEIRRIAAYKTPQDKVACVVRCSQTIMNLLSIASSKSVPAADDFVPVMVFVIIKANPPSLLSTVQVNLTILFMEHNTRNRFGTLLAH